MHCTRLAWGLVYELRPPGDADTRAALRRQADERGLILKDEMFEHLLTRERLGSTGLGEGIAIPHCRIDCPRPMAALLRLETPVDFDAPDDAPVDLLFVLIVPPGETSAHLTTLAALARLFQSADNRAALRAGASDAELYDTFVSLVRTGST